MVGHITPPIPSRGVVCTWKYHFKFDKFNLCCQPPLLTQIIVLHILTNARTKHFKIFTWKLPPNWRCGGTTSTWLCIDLILLGGGGEEGQLQNMNKLIQTCFILLQVLNAVGQSAGVLVSFAIYNETWEASVEIWLRCARNILAKNLRLQLTNSANFSIYNSLKPNTNKVTKWFSTLPRNSSSIDDALCNTVIYYRHQLHPTRFV